MGCETVLVFDACKPIIGVVHLPPLPGSPAYKRRLYPGRIGRKWSIDEIYEYAVEEARKYRDAGFDAVIIENYGDMPYSMQASVGEVASMASIAREVARKVDIPVGLNILRNSGYEAVYAAYIAGAGFVRVNSLCEYRIAVEGMLSPNLPALAKALSELNAYDAIESGALNILADINVKHSWPLLEKAGPEDLVVECLSRAGFAVKGVIVTGARTGSVPSKDYVSRIKKALKGRDVLLLVGSGITTENLGEYWRLSDGFIVGTSVKLGGRTENVVSVDRAKKFIDVVKRYREVWPCTKPR